MNQYRQTVWSFAISLVIVLVVFAFAEFGPTVYYTPHVIISPGMSVGLIILSIIYPHEAHSDRAWLVMAIIANALMYTLPILLLWRLFTRILSK